MFTYRKNLRIGADGLINFIRFITFLSWAMMFTVFILISLARPRFDTMFERFYHSFTYGSWSLGMWDGTLLGYAFYLLLPTVGLSILGLLLNRQRHKRKRDTYSKSLIIIGLTAFAGSLLYYIFYLM